MRTTLFINNMHCPSCVTTISTIFTSPPFSLSEPNISLLTGLVELEHESDFDISTAIRATEDAGFEVDREDTKGRQSSTSTRDGKRWFETRRGRDERLRAEREEQLRRAEAHRATCKACQEWDEGTGKGKDRECVVSIDDRDLWRTELVVEGMTCASCLGTVKTILSSKQDERIVDSDVTLVPGRAVVTHRGSIKPEDLLAMLDDGGYDGQLASSEKLEDQKQQQSDQHAWVQTKIVIEGMTCASCVGTINHVLRDLPGVRTFDVTLIPGLATIVHDSTVLPAAKIVEEIEDGGYGAETVSSQPLYDKSNEAIVSREVRLRIDGMFCEKCSDSLNALFSDLRRDAKLRSYTRLSLSNPTTTIVYEPQPPDGFTLRSLQSLITSKGPFTVHVVRSADTLTLLARKAQAREARNIGIRVLITFVFAIPTFLIAIVFMSLLPSSDQLRQYFSAPVWGSASRGTVALFALVTPIQFGVGSIFYLRSWKSVRGVWRRRSWRDRLLRWGSMDTLVALGTTAGWTASVAYMALDISQPAMNGMGGDMGYFDSSVFLMLFILAGRWLEGVGRRKTGEAVEKLGQMKSPTGILWEEDIHNYDKLEKIESRTSSDDVPPQQSSAGSSIAVDFLERGDTIIVPSGAAVPLDSVLLSSSSSSNFDESSLTGEAKPVQKGPDDSIFAGSTNLGPSAVVARVVTGPGETMMDGIVAAVRDAMARKASLERIADLITGYFVPAIVAIACITFGIWIVRGYSGNLPHDWLEGENGRRGGWALFAVQFAVAVLVVACPCGIGLAAPTAQMVGMGLAARMGIVPYGGSEAFQQATRIDCVVFDKTGTLTTGIFEVSHSRIFDDQIPSSTADAKLPILRMVELVEQTSAHPISTGIRSFCQRRLAELPTFSTRLRCLRTEEIPGRGLSARVIVDEEPYDILVGNGSLLDDNAALRDNPMVDTLAADWSDQGASIISVAIRPTPTTKDDAGSFITVALFGVQDPPRPETPHVIEELSKLGIMSFMCTGDNNKTALAVAKRIGINDSHVSAGLLPVGKQEFIESLQRGSAADQLEDLRRKESKWQRFWRRRSASRTKVMFVGDGINDIVALTQADVGVSMGTGASAALTSSDFCLLSSNLLSVLTLLSLAKATYNKIFSNFAWACCFNVVLIPIAAGAFYDLGKTRLPPVWASLAMALSSISVVTNSLLLRWTFNPPSSVKSYLNK